MSLTKRAWSVCIAVVFAFLPASAVAQGLLYDQAKTWNNPAPMKENWKQGVALTSQGGLWDLALVDGAGYAMPSPYHAGSINVVSESPGRPYLGLKVSYDPDFDSESDSDWQWGMAANTRYNNAFLTGMAGWMPDPGSSASLPTEIVVKFKARWPKGYQSLGTSGVWLEEQGTFDAQGLMVKAFQAAGLSYTSAQSVLFPGLGIEGVTAFVPDNYSPLPPVDLTQWHTYVMTLRWKDQTTMVLGVAIDQGARTEIDVRPFGPFEVQLWRDNYLIVYDPVTYFRISHMNFPQGWDDEFQVGKLRIWEREIDLGNEDNDFDG